MDTMNCRDIVHTQIIETEVCGISESNE